MKVTALHRYPVKSMGGQSVARARIEPIGLVGDRRWMVVNEAGRYMTRRELPQLAQIEALPDTNGILLRHRAGGEIRVPFPPAGAASAPVKIWRDELPAQIADPAADAYLSALFGKPLRLVYQADEHMRPVDPAFAEPGDVVSLADGFPILVTTTESLAALNARLGVPVAMERFRPNVVLSGATEPWAEDRWRRIRIGTLVLRIVKPCARCIMITQDPATGEQIDGDEPLPTLRAMGRQSRTGIIFGQNAIPEGSADIAVGDEVEILDAGESNLVFATPKNRT